MSRAIDLSGKRFGRLIVDFRSIRKTGKNTAAYWICVCDCGNVTRAAGDNLRKGKVRSCGCLRKRTGEAHPLWAGGTVRSDEGYVIFRNLSGRRISEHRYVMELHLKRRLLPHENVHHINGVRHDNRLENLELWSTSQPCGQRVADKITWCYELLAQYGIETNMTLEEGIRRALSQ